MALRIETFDNASGGNTLYKALTHPAAAAPGRELKAALARHAPTAIYDPDGAVAGFAEIFGLDGIGIAGAYVQDVARIGGSVLGHKGRPATDLPGSGARSVFVARFDSERAIAQLRAYLPKGAAIFSLDAMRVPAERLTNPRRYLDPLNFATNFVFFRDGDGLHTRLTTVNYWSGYGAGAVTCWLTLFGTGGEILAEWSQRYPAGAAIVVDSREIRARLGLGEFAGQLFLHVAGAAGHDIVKYALDTFGTGGTLSATHDANAWPANRYAGLPAPGAGERVVLWVQNSHPVPIPSAAIALNPMGEERLAPLTGTIAPFASLAVDVASLLPDIAWPRQIEIRAGKHMVRPRYEVVANGRRRIAHVNVEREDLAPDPNLPLLAGALGKGYLLPAPVLPCAEWQTVVLPTPMALCQQTLPIAALVYDAEGNEILRHRFGALARDHAVALDLDQAAGIEALAGGYGHIELVYDFAAGAAADGWLHAIFCYRRRDSGHAAETSFGAHVFNTLLTYRDEPQSYAGPPPGLSTRLFLRLAADGSDTLCQLIYPASRPWLPASTTDIILYDCSGREVARSTLAIPCSGSRLWSYHAKFDSAVRARAGEGAYAVIRDATCRLFGYHGVLGSGGAFSLDHMFGF